MPQCMLQFFKHALTLNSVTEAHQSHLMKVLYLCACLYMELIILLVVDKSQKGQLNINTYLHFLH